MEHTHLIACSVVSTIQRFSSIGLAGSVVEKAIAAPGPRLSGSDSYEDAAPATVVHSHLHTSCVVKTEDMTFKYGGMRTDRVFLAIAMRIL